MADITIKVGADTSEYEKGIGNLSHLTSSIMKGQIGANLITKGLEKGFGAMKDGFMSVIGAGESFESMMSQVQALSGASVSDMEILTEKAKEFGATTMFSATQSAEALKYMALAGWDTQQSIDALGGVLNLAAAGGMDLGRASDMITDYISAFGLEAGNAIDMANKMSYAQANSNTSAEQLGEAYSNCATNLAAAGQTMESTTALLMAMADVGNKGHTAGTGLSAIMAQLTQKMENGKVAINGTNIALADEAGNWRDLIDILADVEQATAGLGEAARSQALGEVFNRKSLSAINNIFASGIDKVEEYKKALDGVDEGYSSDQAETMMDNLAGSIRILESAMEGLKLTAYDSVDGVAKTFVQGMTDVVNSINDVMKNGFSSEGMETIIESLFTVFDNVADQIKPIIDNAFSAIVDIFPQSLSRITDGLAGIMSGAAKYMPKLIKGMFSALPDIFSSIGTLLPQITESLGQGIGVMLVQSIEKLPEIIMNIVPSLVKSVASAFKGLGEGLLLGMQEELKVPEYESLGNLQTELTYDVSTDADVDNSGAQASVVAKMVEFTDYLKTQGLTAGQISTLYAFTGTTEELQAFIDKNFSGISADAKQAIINHFKESTLADSLSDLNIGLTNEDIAKIIGFVKEGDDTGLATYLEANCPDFKAEVMTAIKNSWNNSSASLESGVNDTDVGFVTQMIVDMFTDGLTDNQTEIDAAVASAKEVLDAKKKELVDYINDGGEDVDGAQSAINQIDALNEALDDYAVNYANKSTEVCAEQGAILTQMASQCEDATNKILGLSQEMLSYQEQMFRSGTKGTKLQSDDLLAAMSFITIDETKSREQLEKNRQMLSQKAGDDAEAYQEVQDWYFAEIEKLEAKSKQRMAELLLGQANSKDLGMIALDSLSKQLEVDISQIDLDGNKSMTVTEVSEWLKSIGYSPDVINQAMQALFGENGYTGESIVDTQNLDRMLEGYDFTNVGNMIQTAVANGIVSQSDVDSLGMSGVISNMLTTSLSEIPDLDVEGESLGKDLVDGYSNAIEAGGSRASVASGTMTSQTLKQIQATQVSASPSEVTKGYGNDFVDGYVLGIQEKASDAATAAAAMVSEATAVAQATPIVVTVETQTVTDTSGASQGGKEVAKAGADAMASASGQFTSAGSNAGEGFKSGLESKRASIMSVARSIANEVAATIRAALNIHSPSRVMMELGSYTGEGFEVGLRQSLNSAVATARGVVSSMNLAPNTGVEALGDAINGLTEASGEGSKLYLNVNGKTLADVTTNNFNSALNANAHRIALGYGRG